MQSSCRLRGALPGLILILTAGTLQAQIIDTVADVFTDFAVWWHVGDVEIDDQGDLYYMDHHHQEIIKVDKETGAHTIVAYTRAHPTGFAVDAVGNVYVCNHSLASGEHYNRVYKYAAGIPQLSPSTIFAGNGVSCWTGVIGTGPTCDPNGSSDPIDPSADPAPATSVPLNWPVDVEVDDLGNVYIQTRTQVLKVDIQGLLTVVAGHGEAGFTGDGGLATSAALETWRTDGGIAFDGYGNLFIADGMNGRVRRVDTDGYITTVAGNGTYDSSTNDVVGVPGLATDAQVGLYSSIDVDATGNLYITDTAKHRVLRVDAFSGIITTVAGTGADLDAGDCGLATDASLRHPNAVCVDGTGGIFIQTVRHVRHVSFGIPTANAGANLSVLEGQPAVMLDGTASTGIDFHPLTYSWMQVPGGPVVTLSDAASPQPTFDAPALLQGGATLSFELTVTAGCVSATDTVDVTVALTNLDHPPVANAGADFSVDEGQIAAMLDGSASTDPDGDPLTYFWMQVASGLPVDLSDDTAQQPTFDAPAVSQGGETFSFELTVTAAGASATDTVSVTVVNVNHVPVADAGDDQSIAEGSPVTLRGEDSFDIDNDSFSYSWVQVGGSPSVTLTDATTATPGFIAPYVAAGGVSGVVATLLFELTVDDGYPQDAPAPGYTFADFADTVTIEVTNLNNDPIAAAGPDQTVDENTQVTLDGTGSSDPDDDTLTYSWMQVGGGAVILSDPSVADPCFSAPFAGAGGEDLTFEVTVSDGYGGSATDAVVIHLQNVNDPPLVSAARPTVALLWPPSHGLVAVGIIGVSDPDGNATITIDGVSQDEPTNGLGDGDTAIDAILNGDGTVMLRAERAGTGDGRVYHIYFTASDPEGSASGVVTVSVPRFKKSAAVDGGPLYDSTE